MTSMARFDLAPVDPDIEPFVRKSAGGSWYSSKGSMVWTEHTSDQARGEAILSHELSHFFVHVGTPYGMLIASLGQLQERRVVGYCAALAEQGSPVRYPVYGYVQRDDALRGMSRDQYLGFYASVFMTYGLDRADSQEGFNRAFETFIALCDLALQTPIGSIYGKLRPPDCDYGDLHPGWRFLRLLDNITDDDWIDSLDDLPGLQKTLAARLGWPDPRKFQIIGSSSDQPAHAEAMRIRQREPAFHLFLQESSASAFLAEHGPLVRDPRTGEITPSLHDRVKLGPVINYIMWRLTWQVMMGPRLDVDEALPAGVYERRWFENIDTKQDLAALFFEAVPALNPENFVLT